MNMNIKSSKSFKRCIGVLLSVLFLLILPVPAHAVENTPKVIILSDTNQTKGRYPILEECTQDRNMLELINNSFIKTSLEFYKEAQKYSNLSDEPFYLVFKENSGCYAKMGFYIKKNGVLSDKTGTPYIELRKEHLTGDFAKFDSITQLLPHEMGHVLTMLACGDYTLATELVNMEMHYSDVITDYSTAFREGFAEHFEILAREYEKNENIQKGIETDYRMLIKKITPVIPRADRDFILPLRLDYYRETSIFWFDRIEGLKRNDLPQNGDCIFNNKTIRYGDVQKSLIYKNTGLTKDRNSKRSYSQSMSTESVISRFFLLLNRNSSAPLIDQYSDIIRIFNKYLWKNKKPALIQFVNGYITEHPEQKEAVLKIFKEATGYEFTEEFAPNIWLMTKNGSLHMAIDQFGSIKYSFKTININTCGVENLLNLDGMDRNEAGKIITYRDRIGYFQTTEDFDDITGIQPATLVLLRNSILGSDEWSEEKVSKMYGSMDSLDFDMMKVLASNLEHLALRALILFVIFFTVYFLLVIRSGKKYVKDFITQLFKFILYVFTGLAAAIAPMCTNTGLHPVMLFCTIITIVEAIKLLIIRKDRSKVGSSILSTVLLAPIIIYSLI